VFPDKKKRKNTVRRKEQKEFERGERGNNVPFEREKGSKERGGRVRGVRVEPKTFSKAIPRNVECFQLKGVFG